MPNRSGLVSEIVPPQSGKASGSAKLGSRKVWFFWTQYQSEEPSEILVALRDAEARGVSITLDGEEFQGQGPNGAYTSFSAKSVSATGGGSNGAQNGSQGQEQRFVGREAGANDRWVAARWALSVAADIKINGVKIVGEYDVMPLVEQAWWLLEQSKGLAERLEG